MITFEDMMKEHLALENKRKHDIFIKHKKRIIIIIIINKCNF